MLVDLRIYLVKNLGDDLFLEIISSRYKNTKFIIYPSVKYYIGEINPNIIIKDNALEVKYNYLCNKFKLYFLNTNRFVSKRCDATVIVGGSIFQESKNWHILKKKISLYNNLNPKYYILGCNFGPFKSKKFLSIHKDIIKNSKDVCFRDMKSYTMFEQLPNVRYASDLVFSLDTKKYNTEQQKKVVISLIDLSWRNNLSDYLNHYENKIIEMIIYFINKQYQITLMSFSKFEGDEKAIERVISKLPIEYSDKINKYYYTGNIKSALLEISSSEIVVASRFHANVLGLLFHKTVIPIIYSNKTANLLNDINFKGKKTTIEEINSFDVNFSDKDLSYKVNIDKEIESSQNQFLRLDDLLKQKE